MRRLRPAFFAAALLSAAGHAPQAAQAQPLPFSVTEIARFDQPWALAFLPDGRLLVTQKAGKLVLYSLATRKAADVRFVPPVAYGGQGGLADVVLHPKFRDNGLLYLSYAETGPRGLTGAAVARAQLTYDAAGGPQLEKIRVIWRQDPKVSGRGQYAGRLAFSPDGHLFVSSGERQKLTPAQDLSTNLGKIVRLDDDGSIPEDNPFYARGGVAAEVWSLGHRNPLGLAFDAQGRLWSTEMGPLGGDELNLIERGANYGWPVVSNGEHYDGRPIPEHATHPEFHAPTISWTPVIAPSGLMFYDGSEFPRWRGSAFIGGLAAQTIVRVTFDGITAREAERFPMRHRIRAVAQGPDGALWVLEDGGNARLLRLSAPH